MIALVALAATAGVSDARTRQIPNEVCLAIAILGIAFQLARAFGAIPPWLSWEGRVALFLPAPAVCVALAIGLGIIGLSVEAVIRRRLGRRGMGLGDVKYVVAWTLTLGPAALPGIALACLSGAAWALLRRRRDFALGPWLSAFFCITLLVIPSLR